MSAYGRRIFRLLLVSNVVAWLALACLLTGCATSAPGPERIGDSDVWRGPQGTDWAKLGVTKVVKLNCAAEGSDAYAEAQGIHVREVCISPRTDRNPVVQYFSGPTDAELRALDRIARELAARTGSPAGIHCTHGCDRTGLLAAMVQRYRGMTEGQARWYLEHAAGGCYHGLPGVDRAWRRWNDTIYAPVSRPNDDVEVLRSALRRSETERLQLAGQVEDLRERCAP